MIPESTSQVVRPKLPGSLLRRIGPASAAAQGGSVRSSENVRMPRDTSLEQFEVAVDCRRLARKMSDQVLAERLLAGHRIIDTVTDEEPVVVRVHRRPLELVLAEEIHHAAHGGLRAHVAEVVHADVPLVAIALVAVRRTTRGVVLLENGDFPAEFGEQRGGGESTDSRADDQCVVRAVQPGRAVAFSDTEGAGLEVAHLRSLTQA